MSAEPRTLRGSDEGVVIDHGGTTPLGPSRIYDQMSVPKADDPGRRSRLALCCLSADILKLVLG